MAESAPAAATGASFTGVTRMPNDTAAEVSMPPFAVPPLSWSWTVIVAAPFAFGAVVNVSTPVGLIAGSAANSAGLLVETRKVSVCDDSFAGPAEMLAAHAAEYGPASSATVTFPPDVN